MVARRRLCVASLICIVVASAAVAAPVDVRVLAHGVDRVEGRIVATNAASGASSEAVAAGSIATLDLAPGPWQLRFERAGTWSSSQLVEVAAAGAATAATVDVWPGTTLRMRLTSHAGATLPKTAVHLHLDGTSRDAPESADIDCASDEQAAVVCSVPAGAFDVRLTVNGYAAEYRSPVRFARDAPSDFGSVAFHAGTAVAGRVAFAEGKQKLSDVVVRLDSMTERKTASTKANERGWFVFSTVPRGLYRIAARTPRGDLSDAREIRVSATGATELREPLVLAPPKTLRVVVVPPIPATDQRWRIRLERIGGGRYDRVDEGDAASTGEWTATGLVRGEYRVNVGPDAKSFWVFRDVEVAEAAEEVTVEAKPVHVEGTVTLGGRPLQAELFFGGEHASIQQRFRSKADGTFAGRLTGAHEPAWPITVIASHPSIARDVTATPQVADDGTLRFDIQLPATMISGRVVNEDGHPEPHVMINVFGDDAMKQLFAEDDGTFQIAGLAPGAYTLQASSGYLGESDATPIEVGSEAVENIELKLRKEVEFRALVTFDGEPLANVPVSIAPTNSSVMMFMQPRSQPDGSIRLPLNGATGDLDLRIFPPGFAFSAFHTRLSREPIAIPLSKVSGTLKLSVPAWDEKSAISPVFVHRGAVLALELFEYEWSARRTPLGEGRVLVTIPMVEPGDYALCLAPAHQWPVPVGNRCTSGTLAPYATLELAIQ